MKCSSAQLVSKRKYDAAHREERLAYRAAHKEEKSIRSAAYYLDHRDEILARQNAYNAVHQDEAAAYRDANRDSRLEKQSKEYAEFTEWLRILRTNNGCEDCGTHEGLLHHHHIDPSTKRYWISAMYGCSLDTLEEELEKCVVLCVPCHNARHETLRAVKREEHLAKGVLALLAEGMYEI